jgi:LacI family transcriptional regulator
LNRHIELPDQTALRIDSAVHRLGYQPNAIARRLSRGSSETIGFVTTDIAYPFFAAIASSAEEEAAKHGYNLAIFNSRNQVDHELAFLSKIEDHQIDGALFMTNHADDGVLRDKISKCRKVVLLDEDVVGTTVPKLFADNEEGGRLATQHVIDQGHSRIAHISGPIGMTSADERFRGFLHAMRGAGLSVDPALVRFGSYEEEFAVRVFLDFWNQSDRPTAIIAASDLLAVGIMRGARRHDIAIPRDLSVVGFDDMLHMDLLDPPLTAVRQSTAEFGRRGIQMLLDLLRDDAGPEPAGRIALELVSRGSVAPPRPVDKHPKTRRVTTGTGNSP